MLKLFAAEPWTVTTAGKPSKEKILLDELMSKCEQMHNVTETWVDVIDWLIWPEFNMYTWRFFFLVHINQHGPQAQSRTLLVWKDWGGIRVVYWSNVLRLNCLMAVLGTTRSFQTLTAHTPCCHWCWSVIRPHLEKSKVRKMSSLDLQTGLIFLPLQLCFLGILNQHYATFHV